MECNKRPLASLEDEPGPSSKVAIMEMQLEEESNKEDEKYDTFFEKLIQIEVVFDKLERALSYKDLKSLRLVSKKCEEVVLKHKLLRKTKLIVRDRTINSKVLNNLRFKPEHMKIEQFVGMSLEELKTSSLEENDMRKLNEMPGYRITKEGVPVWSFEEFKPLLKLCEDVKILEIQGPQHSDLPEYLLRVFPPVNDLLAAAKSLNSLKLMCTVSILDYKENLIEAKGQQMEEPTVAVDKLILEGPCGSILRCIKGFERLTAIKIMMSMFVSGVERDTYNYSYIPRIMTILKEYRSTIQSVELESSDKNRRIFTLVFDVDDEKMPTFPNLKIFKTSFSKYEGNDVRKFISSHFSHLKELTLDFKAKPKTKVPSAILKFLVKSNSNTLSALRLYHPAARQYNARVRDLFTLSSNSLNVRHLSALQEFVVDLGNLDGLGIRLEDLPSSLRKVFISPCHEILDSLFPVMRNIHKVFKVLPDLEHLELRRYSPDGRRDIVLTDLQRIKKKPKVARELEMLMDSEVKSSAP